MTLQTSQFADELNGVPANPKDRRLAASVTPKEFRHLAQGCRASRLPWVRIANSGSTLKGLRRPPTTSDGTPLGYGRVAHPSPR